MTTPLLPPPPRRRPGLSGRLSFDPLAPLAAVLPLIALVGLSSSWHPAVPLLGFAAVACAVVRPGRGMLAAGAVLVFTAALTAGLAASARPSDIFDPPTAVSFLPWLPAEQWNAGLNTSARIGAIIMLVILAGLMCDPYDTVRAFVVHLRMPERIAQAGIAALSFGPILRREHASILEAHILRGSRYDLPLIEVPARWLRSTPALVAAAIRHAERVAMSMDARAFGAHPTRTQRTDFAWRTRDTLLVALAWIGAALFIYSQCGAGFAFAPNRA